MRPKYSICITHYNMNETVRASLESILGQVDENYEILVVDAGSDDGSLEYLTKMDKKGKIRLIVEEGCKIGEGWNIGAEKARGEYLILKLDLDDRYKQDVIPNFVEIYHQIERNITDEFFLSSSGLNICPRELFMDIGGFRDLKVEDKDFWRRLIAEDKLVELKSYDTHEQIGCYKSRIKLLKRDFWTKYSEIRSGVDPLSLIRWHLKQPKSLDGNSWFLLPWHLSAVPVAWLMVKIKEGSTYDAPEGLKDFGKFREEKEGLELNEIEDKYNFKINKEALTDKANQRYKF